MAAATEQNDDGGMAARHEGELASLRERLESTEQHMAQTLMRATRLAQVISVLGNEKDLETTVERAAIEVGELFFADMALLILDSDDGPADRRTLGRRRLRPAERAVRAPRRWTS